MGHQEIMIFPLNAIQPKPVKARQLRPSCGTETASPTKYCRQWFEGRQCQKGRNMPSRL